jgi:hypothetical protein
METKDDITSLLLDSTDDWSKYLAVSGSDTYKKLLKEIEEYIEKRGGYETNGR